MLVGIKYLEAKGPRDGGLLVCLALFLTLTQFFYDQGIAAAAIALPVVLVLGGALAALRAAPAAMPGWKAPLAATARMLVQGFRWRCCCSSCFRAWPVRCGAHPWRPGRAAACRIPWRRA